MGKRVMEVPGKTRKGRPRRLDNIKQDLTVKELSDEETLDRDAWRQLILNTEKRC